MKILGIILLSVTAIGLLFFVFSRNGGVRPSYYYDWLNSKESTVSKWQSDGGFIFNLNFRPKEFMALSEFNGEELSKPKFENALRNFECCEHLLLKIFASDTFSEALSYRMMKEQDYYERIRYLNSIFGERTYLLDGTDTLDCTFYHFERAYKIRPYISLNLIYEKKRHTGSDGISLIIEPTIFNTRQLKFDIRKEDIESIPKLKL